MLLHRTFGTRARTDQGNIERELEQLPIPRSSAAAGRPPGPSRTCGAATPPPNPNPARTSAAAAVAAQDERERIVEESRLPPHVAAVAQTKDTARRRGCVPLEYRVHLIVTDSVLLPIPVLLRRCGLTINRGSQ